MINCRPWDDKQPLNGRGLGHVTHFKIMCPFPHYVFGTGEDGHSKSGMQMDIDEYWHMHDRLPSQEMCSGSCDLFSFGEITDNVSKTVQYIDK